MDFRNIRNGWEIPTENYCDQPYVVIADDGAWVMSVTTGVGHEGQNGQHVVVMRSIDCGKTWVDAVDIEPANGPEASYSVLLKAPSGRIFCFYNHNTDNLRQVKANFPSGFWDRVDSQGHYVFRYSDDCGKTWSPHRIEIPVRKMQMDRENPYGGDVQFFWNVGRPVLSGTEVFLTLHRIGSFGPAGGYESSEGIFLHSADLLLAENPEKATWQTLPDGEIGLRAPEGPVAEEQCLVELSDGSFFCVWRTVAGSAACAYSRDRCHTWTKIDFMRYPDGRKMKHPRAANFIWKLEDGHFLYWYHNQGRKSYAGRNPAWVSLGTEYDAPDGRRIAWSDPEILLYDPDRALGISYPDLVQQNGEYYVTETQKTIARTSWIDPQLIAGMIAPVAPMDGEALQDQFDGCQDGFSLCLNVETNAGEILRVEGKEGELILLEARDDRVYLLLHDGECAVSAFTDLLSPGMHRLCMIADPQPGILTFLVDGVLCDGGDRPQGWFRMPCCIPQGDVVKGQGILLFRRPLHHYEGKLL